MSVNVTESGRKLELYILNLQEKFFSSKNTFAYLTTTEKVLDNVQPSCEYLFYECPYCGDKQYRTLYSPLIAVFNKDKLGDFAYGSTGTSASFAVNEFVKSRFEESTLKGIKKFIKYDEIWLAKNNQILTDCKNYYDVFIEISKCTIDRNKSILSHPVDDDKECNICAPGGISFFFNKSNISLNLENYEGYDIFTIYEDTNLIFVTQKFYDFCKENIFTNIIENLVNVNEYVEVGIE